MDDRGTGLVVLLLGDPHLLEGGEGGQDGSSVPDRKVPLRGGDDPDLDGAGGLGNHLLLHSVSDSCKPSCECQRPPFSAPPITGA